MVARNISHIHVERNKFTLYTNALPVSKLCIAKILFWSSTMFTAVSSYTLSRTSLHPKSNSSRCAPQARYAGEKTAAWGDAGVLGAACFPVAPQPSTLQQLIRGAAARLTVGLLRVRWEKVRGERRERRKGGERG